MLTIKCFLELTGFCKSPGPGNANIFNQFLEDTDNSQIQSKQPIALSEVKMKRSFIHATCYGFKVEWNNKYPSQSIQRGDERKEVGAQCCTFWVELVMAWRFLTNIHHSLLEVKTNATCYCTKVSTNFLQIFIELNSKQPLLSPFTNLRRPKVCTFFQLYLCLSCMDIEIFTAHLKLQQNHLLQLVACDDAV